jgi:hypothetical protein
LCDKQRQHDQQWQAQEEVECQQAAKHGAAEQGSPATELWRSSGGSSSNQGDVPGSPTGTSSLVGLQVRPRIN